MTFEKGNFVKLVATTTIHLGKIEKNLSKEDVVEFDGFEVKVFGQTVQMPELKAGLKRGWLKLHEGSSSLPTEKEAVVPTQEPALKMKVQKVYDEERPVAEVKKKETESEKKKFQVIVEQQENEIIPVAKIKSTSGATIASDNASSGIHGEAVTINLKTASKVKTVLSDGSQVSSEINRLDKVSARQEFPIVRQAEDAVEVSSFVEMASEESSEEQLDNLLESLDTPDEQALEDAQLLQAIEGEIAPDQGAVTLGKNDSKLISLPVGVDWDMSPHWSKRAKIAVERYSEHLEILEAIKAVETKGVVRAINKGLEG